MTEAGRIPPRARVVGAIGEVDASGWNACAAGDPFVSHEFLRALEESGSAVPEHGWIPRHVVLEDERGIVAAAPAYLKTHSYGEYVFDFAWAEAHARCGRSYYPKLQCCVPFTPATGPRLLVRPDAEAGTLRRRLVSALLEVATHENASSLHITFPRPEEAALGASLGLLPRSGIQYHWHNRGYRTFDDFLDTLLGRKRRVLLRERRDANASLAIDTLRGDAIGSAEWNVFYGFYRDTVARKWGQAYLTREFFDALGATLGDRVALVVARQDGRTVAAALNLLGPDVLFGRYWGATVDVPFLHFELCYYRAIELAIELGLSRVEAGAQGEHKIARGYLPVETHSLHAVVEPRLAVAIEEFVGRERDAVHEAIEELRRASPYRDLRSSD
ncbi:MAG: N-acetyltransferase [Deltaproteobacteria bacterium]|nr:N-acetyltransferase [Deltaproteobacteria bacterium]